MKHKTQVFITPYGDHFRTRLTHTLEVSQIARTIARALRLNEDLTEAVSLGHDLGHTPFGHCGENALNRLCQNGFSHTKQSLRIVEVLEKEGRGLNLTREVRDGILNHSGSGNPKSLEGRVVQLADRIAYLNHDIDDAVRGGVLSGSDIPNDISLMLGRTHRERINTLIRDVIEMSRGQNDIAMSEAISGSMEALRDFMFERIYKSDRALREEEKATFIIETLFVNYLESPPDSDLGGFVDTETAVCDYIAGMSDHFAIEKFKERSIPVSWQLI